MSLLSRLKARFLSPPGTDAHITRLKRRKKIYATIGRIAPYLQAACYLSALICLLLLPIAPLSKNTYVDENALQPGQVNTYWDWRDVHAADRYLEGLESLRNQNATEHEKAQWLKERFDELGIPADTQEYTFRTSLGDEHGVNTYAIYHSPRTSGAEAIVLAAPWVSRTGDPNLRGIAMILSLAAFLKRYSHWAKDLIFLIPSSHLSGTQAFLTSYHTPHSPPSTLTADPLTLDGGVIWTALALDYPGHSFSHLGIFYEGLNGRLPNLDLLVCAQIIARWTGGVPVLLHNTLDELRQDLPLPSLLSLLPSWAAGVIGGAVEWIWREVVNRRSVKDYEYRAKNMAQQAGWMGSGRASGAHGVFHQFRIDAITLFARPAMGPHGFHTLGKITESLLRTLNNLLERLHASFFFYLLSSPASFLKIGTFLPSSALIGVGCLIGGLRGYVEIGWEGWYSPKTGRMKYLPRPRRLMESLGLVLGLFGAGGVLFAYARSSLFPPLLSAQSALPLLPVALALSLLPPFLVLLRPPPNPRSPTSGSPLAPMLHTTLLLLLSLLIIPLSLLNYPLSLSLSLLALPLSLTRPSSGLVPFLGLSALNPVWLLLLQWGRDEARRAVWEWDVLGVWMLPLACGVWVPLVWVGQAVCLIQE